MGVCRPLSEEMSMRTPKTQRFYAARLPEPYTRHQQVGFRVCGSAKRLLIALASARGMSVSEYLARLVSDHLAAASRGAP